MDEVQLEGRLTRIEDGLTNGLDRIAVEIRTTSVEVSGMKEAVKRQNGRVGKLEEWRIEMDRIAAHARGVADGRAGITRMQMAFLTIVGPIMFALADLGLRYLV